MRTNRKIQLGAAAVILNGVVALSGLYSEPALASGCSPLLSGCTTQLPQCPNGVQAFCEGLQPGCTVTSSSCNIVPSCPFPPFYFYSCQYL